MKIIQLMDGVDWIIFAITVIAYIILIIDILKYNGISQNFYTWFLWGILDTILFINTYKEEASDLPLIFGCLIGSFSIAFLLALTKKVKFRKKERKILYLVIITTVIWLWSGSSLVGIISSVIAEIIAGIPLMRSSWKKPGSRLTLISYSCFLISYIISIYHSDNWNIKNVLFPIAFLIYSILDTLPLVIKWCNIYYRYRKLKSA